jgi:hypothetical protein
MTDLQGSSPVTLELVASGHGDRDTERELHTLYALSRHRGEWFALTDDDVAEITERLDGYHHLGMRTGNARSGPVKVTNRDGTVEYRPAYSLPKLRRAMQTRKAKKRRH